MTKLTAEKKDKFLATLARGGSVSRAAAAIGVSRNCLYIHRREDPEFLAAWEDAYEQGTDRIEDVALELATTGSVPLVIFLLKSRRKDVYSEKVIQQHQGADGGPLTVILKEYPPPG
jgi:hypothetical protein